MSVAIHNTEENMAKALGMKNFGNSRQGMQLILTHLSWGLQTFIIFMAKPQEVHPSYQVEAALSAVSCNFRVCRRLLSFF